MKDFTKLIRSFIKQIFISRFVRIVLFLLASCIGSYFLLNVLRGEIIAPSAVNLPFGISINLYSFTLLLGVVSALFIINSLMKWHKELNKVDIWEGLVYVLIPGIVGARIYHVLTDWYLYVDNPTSIFEIWNGGLGFIGAVVGGVIGLYLFTKRRKLDIWIVIRVVLVALPVGHAIGRFGNLFNYELYGFPTELPWGLFVPFQHRSIFFLDSQFFHPLFLYEVIGNLAIAFLMYAFWKRGFSGKHMLLTYINLYGLLRFILDFFRISGVSGFAGLSYAQWLFVLLIGTVGIWQLSKWFKKKGINF